MKKIILCTLFIFFTCLTSCGRDTTQLAKDEFSKYLDGEDEVFLVNNNLIYTEKTQLDLNDLVDGEEPNGGLIIKQNTLFFSTCVQNSMFDYTLNIYESNISGTETQLLFSKAGYRTHPWVYENDDNFYIEHYSENGFVTASRIIDRYSVRDNKYETVGNGEDCDISAYFEEESSQYKIEMIENSSPQKHGKFIITDLESGIEKNIDDDYLESTIYIASMGMFNYGPKRFDVSNGHILLTYGIGAGDGWNYPHLVFEYDFESDMLEYKLLAFPHDNEPACTELIYVD